MNIQELVDELQVRLDEKMQVKDVYQAINKLYFHVFFVHRMNQEIL